MAGEFVDAVGLRALLLCQPIRLMRERVQLARRELLLCSAQQVRRVTELFGSLSCCVGALLRTRAALHRIACLAKTAQCLLDPLV